MITISTQEKANIYTLTTPDGTEQILPRTVVEAIQGIDAYAKVADMNSKETPAGAQAKADAAKSSAILTASTDATAKANTAEQNAKSASDPKGSAATVDGKLTTHIGDSTKHVTTEERAAWNAKETPSGAQAKADAAAATAKSASRPVTWMPTAADVGALATGGGTMTGPLDIHNIYGTFAEGDMDVTLKVFDCRGGNVVFQINTGHLEILGEVWTEKINVTTMVESWHAVNKGYVDGKTRYGASDPGAGASLATGSVYLVYE